VLALAGAPVHPSSEPLSNACGNLALRTAWGFPPWTPVFFHRYPTGVGPRLYMLPDPGFTDPGFTVTNIFPRP
jgi:hypothetical protein